MTSGVTLKRPRIPGHGVQPTLEDNTVAWQTGTRGGNDSVASSNLNLSNDSHLLGGSHHDGLVRPPAIIGTQFGLRHNPARLITGAGRGAIPSLFSTGPGGSWGNRTPPGIFSNLQTSYKTAATTTGSLQTFSSMVLGGGMHLSQTPRACTRDAYSTPRGINEGVAGWASSWMGVLTNHLGSINHFVF